MPPASQNRTLVVSTCCHCCEQVLPLSNFDNEKELGTHKGNDGVVVIVVIVVIDESEGVCEGCVIICTCAVLASFLT